MPKTRWEKKKVKRTSKLWKNWIRLIAVRKQNVGWYKPVKLNELNCSCIRHIINILLTELTRSVWENLDLGRVYRPHCVRSVLTTSVKILPYRPLARLIRAKYSFKIFHRLWLFKTTHIIFHNQLLLTKFGKNLAIPGNEVAKLRKFWWVEKQRAKWRNSFKVHLTPKYFFRSPVLNALRLFATF